MDIIENEDELLEEIQEIPDSEVVWVEEIVDVYEAGGKEFYFDDLVEDFMIFYRYMFLRLGFGEPTEAQLAIAEFLASDNKKDKMVLALRGLAKSLSTQLYTLWRVLRNNDEHILVRSASSKRSRNFTTFLLNLLKTTPPLQHLAPRSNQRKSTELFDVNGAKPSDSPTVYSAGVSANVTGMRATIVISDDIEVPQNSGTPETRQTLLDQYNESINLLVESEEVTGEVIVLGTYQSMNSIYLNLEETGAFDLFMIPAYYPKLDSFYEHRLAPYIKERIEYNPEIIGTAVDSRFTAEKLEKRSLRIGKSAFEFQYMLNPTSNDDLKYPLKLKDLIVMDIDPIDNPLRIIYSSENKIHGLKHRGFNNDYFVAPQWTSNERLPFEFSILAVDPSGRGTDETGWVVISLLAGKVFVRDFGGLIGGYDDEALDRLVLIAREYDVNEVVVESNFGDGSYAKMLAPKLKEMHNCRLEEVRATSQKEARICDTLEPLMNQHRIIVDRKALEKDFDKKTQYSLTYQMTQLTREPKCLKHDDIIDTWQLGVQYLIDYMANDGKRAEEKWKQEQQKKLDALFEDGLFPHLKKKQKLNSFIAKF